MDPTLLKSIIKSTNDIRKKYKAIKVGKLNREMLLEETFKPISNPLREFKEKTGKEIDKKIKTEIKKEYSTMNHVSYPENGNDSFTTDPQSFKTESYITSNSFKTPHKTTMENKNPTFQSTPILQESFKQNRALVSFYVREYMNNGRNVDKAFGPKYNDNTNSFEIGRYKIEFEENTISVGDKEYPATQGLLELIFMKNPDDYSTIDLKNYKDILLRSNVYRTVVNDDYSRVKGNNGEKYRKIISKLIQEKKEVV